MSTQGLVATAPDRKGYLNGTISLCQRSLLNGLRFRIVGDAILADEQRIEVVLSTWRQEWRAQSEQGKCIARLRMKPLPGENRFERPDGSNWEELSIIRDTFGWKIRLGSEILDPSLHLVAEGHREFGSDHLVGLVHFDHSSEAAFYCREDLLGPACIIAFAVFNGLGQASSSGM